MSTSRDDAPVQNGQQSAPSSHHDEALERFILFWGEMASNWGINRTMAQIHALLYCMEEPLDTDAIMEQLQISRGNANMNLRSLIDWNLARKVHQQGSRKDFYVAEKDVWAITARIIQERQQREVKPVVDELKACRATLTGGEQRPCEELPPEDQALCTRIDNLMEVMQLFEGFTAALLPFVQERNRPLLRQLMKLAAASQPISDEPPSRA